MEKCGLQGLDDFLEEHQLAIVDQNVLVWTTYSKDNPKKWPTVYKAINIGFLLVVEAFCDAMSSVGSAAADEARFELGVGQLVAYFVFTTLPLLTEIVASLVVPPLSENYGRRVQFIIAAAICLAGSAITIAPSLAAVIIGRAITGFGTGIPQSIVPGTIEDILEDPGSQTLGNLSYAVTSNTGIILGPVIASQLVAAFGWRSVFYAAMVTSALVFLLSFVFFESRPDAVLQRKLHQLHQQTGQAHVCIRRRGRGLTWQTFVQEELSRPALLVFTEPIVFMCGSIKAIAFALIYGLTESVTVVYGSFGFDNKTSNLAFLAILVGVFASVLLTYASMRKRSGTEADAFPEARLGSFYVSAPALAIGLWIFAWTVPDAVHTHWIVSMIGLVPIGLAATDFDTILADYIVASYGTYSASAYAAMTWFRSVLSAAATVFVTPMYQKLGNNVATSIFAAVATIFCLSPFILGRWGRQLRERSKFASFSKSIGNPNMLT